MSSSAQRPRKEALKKQGPAGRPNSGNKAGNKALKDAGSRGRTVAAAQAAVATGRRIQVRRSGVHGRGVFALVDIPAGELIIEYIGERISWDEALDRHPHNPEEPDHTFYFHIEGGDVIDANVSGNSSRWMNHSCAPNCEADEIEGGRVFIRTLRRIRAGEELNYNYGLTIDERYTPAVKKRFACLCGSRRCTGTMLSPKR